MAMTPVHQKIKSIKEFEYINRSPELMLLDKKELYFFLIP
jgi:hypothetical protein